jgi:hypothetical protein
MKFIFKNRYFNIDEIIGTKYTYYGHYMEVEPYIGKTICISCSPGEYKKFLKLLENKSEVINIDKTMLACQNCGAKMDDVKCKYCE